MPHPLIILFLFALGACIGSFLNVVVWRMPRGESLITPPSHCPKCGHQLAWYDNIPVLGWIKLAGKCRYCGNPISPRYPIVEAITGLLFVFYYVIFFIVGEGPCVPPAMTTINVWGETVTTPGTMIFSRDWPIYFLLMFLSCGLLAASLIDAELYIIPLEIPWMMAGAGILFHAIVNDPKNIGSLTVQPPAAALALGAGVGLLVSIVLWKLKIIPTSFSNGEPILEVDRPVLLAEIDKAKAEGREAPMLPPPYTKAEIRGEIRKEILFLLPPAILGCLWLYLVVAVAPVQNAWNSFLQSCDWPDSVLGSVLGALIGGFVVWITRILGTIGFGRVAMGLGDVHLMFGVGAIIGAAGATVSFFVAPFFGLIIAIYMLATGTRREMPYGPYLSLGTAFVIVFYCRIMDYLSPGMSQIVFLVREMFQ